MLLILCFVVAGCSPGQKHQRYTLGLDPTWFPLELGQQEKQLLAFSIDLLVHIAQQEHLSLVVVTKNWDNLLEGLREKEYEGALSPLQPYSFHRDHYTFSELYLLTGPVLVTRTGSPIKQIEQTQWKAVAIIPGSSATSLLQKYPGLLLRSYETIPLALEAVGKEVVDAAVLNLLLTQKYIFNLWDNRLKIASPPLAQEGMRLLTLQGAHPTLITRFNRGLKGLQKTGTYQLLLDKWGLGPDGHEVPHIDAKLHALFIQLQKT